MDLHIVERKSDEASVLKDKDVASSVVLSDNKSSPSRVKEAMAIIYKV